MLVLVLYHLLVVAIVIGVLMLVVKKLILSIASVGSKRIILQSGSMLDCLQKRNGNIQLEDRGKM